MGSKVSRERCVESDTRVWRGVWGPIDEYGTVCWDRNVSMERCVEIDR